MIRRLLLRALLLFGCFGVLYVTAFWALTRVEVSGTPLIYRCVAALNWKGGNSYMKFEEFDRRIPYDVVFIGSSHAYRGYDPEIFARHGYRTFNLGTSAQSPLNSYFILKEYMTGPKPRLIVLDTYEAAFEVDGLESTADLTQNISSDVAAVEMALALRDPRAVNMLLLRWLRHDVPPMYVDSTYRPGGASLATDSVKGKVQYTVGRPLAMQARQQDYFRCFLELCRERGLNVVLVSHPYPAQADRARHEVFMEWLRAEVAPYGHPVLDFAFDHGLPIDDEDHFYDHNHLNHAGVEIFNAFLIERLEHDGILTR